MMTKSSAYILSFSSFAIYLSLGEVAIMWYM